MIILKFALLHAETPAQVMSNSVFITGIDEVTAIPVSSVHLPAIFLPGRLPVVQIVSARICFILPVNVMYKCTHVPVITQVRYATQEGFHIPSLYPSACLDWYKL